MQRCAAGRILVNRRPVGPVPHAEMVAYVTTSIGISTSMPATSSPKFTSSSLYSLILYVSQPLVSISDHRGLSFGIPCQRQTRAVGASHCSQLAKIFPTWEWSQRLNCGKVRLDFRVIGMTHIHECPRCGTQWECGEANYQDECPYPTKILCLKCWAQAARADASRQKAARTA